MTLQLPDLELPDEVATRFLALTKDEQTALAVSLLRQWADEVDDDAVAIQEGIDDLAAGRHRPLSDFIAERRA